MIDLLGPINSGVATGGAGVATNNSTTTTRVNGRVVGTYIRYNDSPPNTTDVTIKTQGTTSAAVPSYNILNVANAATDGLFLLAPAAVNQAGSAITSTFVGVPVADYVTVLIEQANNGDSVDVWLLVEC